ncbi:hypothetical protein OB2597_02182 [Pseudooceanicola batsensis HTCC2597]|uniref:Uncharacterized protein n=1 Tax=Pseudooceanicola batsensis (strain ATCC BAA-863 / DSM 15984 / KCTC 12145 / HTCC2597) TaxID=252305 RepID=A3TX30_PSEBH|nr:hypothetical protein [Pseudooceanicola batsensis]EAQ03390.1 hypothetical protein OB2597_02182 [Pseudooceanicola batsensis HTCC2597]
MAADDASRTGPNILIVGQSGRLQYEALIFAASLFANSPSTPRLYVAEPQPGPLWQGNPTMSGTVRTCLEALGAEILPFRNEHFGQSYPHGNKIEALAALPADEPFVFFDSDTLILDDLKRVPFDFDRPTASRRVEGTWPKIELYGPGYAAIWKSLYDRFGLDFDSSLDLSQPDEYWRRYLYFNAGVFHYRCPRVFGQRFLDYALAIRDDPPAELACQSLDPWLDQVALPLVIHSLGGGRDVLPEGLLDGEVSCHYRMLPLLYARESDRVVEVLEAVTAPQKIKKVLKTHDPIRRMIYQGRGHKVRALFDRDNLPRREQAIRNRIKREGFWMR